MLRNKIYYRLKPLLPDGLRMWMRRQYSVRLRERVADRWPVLPGSERAPDGWPGWPDGKRFAVVLTHDVEGPVGVANCRSLMELERELGFISSFNFIPAGTYQTPVSLRETLERHGFEIGVHDLHHDGRLYDSPAVFARKAVEINRHLHDWRATGFRSGFMLNELDWLQQLEISYDASTFDTDPFEPQPDGQGTIFPFWVPSRHGGGGAATRGGYVELPYTLTQDSTLFLLLGETTPDVWIEKADWVARHGGMILVNVHPDYMQFDPSTALPRTYPAGHYSGLLTHLRSKYGESFWQPLPRELAAYVASLNPRPLRSARSRTRRLNGHSGEPKLAVCSTAPVPPRLDGRRAAVLLYSYYPSDARPRREAEALAAAGMEVELICLRQGPDEPARETINGVRVSRVPMKRRRQGKLTYFLQYSQFIAWCATALALRRLRRRYDLVHVHNMPDVLVFSALVPKLAGAKVLLDLHDPMPELMRTIFGFSDDHKAVRLLKFLEKCSLSFADRVVTVNAACQRIFGGRSCPTSKIRVIMNTPDESIFRFQPVPEAVSRSPDRPFVLMFHGSIVERHGLDLAVQAVGALRAAIPRIELRVYGQPTPYLEQVLDGCRRDGLEDVVRHFGPRTHEQIVEAIGECDLGVIPNRRSIFTEINTPTRIFEYLSCGKAVIAPRVPGITDYFEPDELIYFELGDADDLARQIQHAYDHPTEIREIVVRGQDVYRQHTWSHEKLEFVDMVAQLLAVRA
ncbi:MAG: glycosyltransferase [Verrucomicrobiales bacterium]